MKIIALVIALFLVLFSLIKFGLGNLKIGAIICRSQFGECSPHIAQKLSGISNSSIGDTKSRVGSILDQSSAVVSYRQSYLFPNKLRVDVVERKALFAIKQSGGSTFAQIDKEGMVVRLVTDNALPLVEVPPAPPNLFEKVSDQELFSLMLISEISKGYAVSQAKLTETGLEAIIEGHKVMFAPSGDLEVVLGTFYTILNQLNNEELSSMIGEKNLELIDLRFKNPVLKLI